MAELRRGGGRPRQVFRMRLLVISILVASLIGAGLVQETRGIRDANKEKRQMDALEQPRVQSKERNESKIGGNNETTRIKDHSEEPTFALDTTTSQSPVIDGPIQRNRLTTEAGRVDLKKPPADKAVRSKMLQYTTVQLKPMSKSAVDVKSMVSNSNMTNTTVDPGNTTIVRDSGPLIAPELDKMKSLRESEVVQNSALESQPSRILEERNMSESNVSLRNTASSSYVAVKPKNTTNLELEDLGSVENKGSPSKTSGFQRAKRNKLEEAVFGVVTPTSSKAAHDTTAIPANKSILDLNEDSRIIDFSMDSSNKIVGISRAATNTTAKEERRKVDQKSTTKFDIVSPGANQTKIGEKHSIAAVFENKSKQSTTFNKIEARKGEKLAGANGTAVESELSLVDGPLPANFSAEKVIYSLARTDRSGEVIRDMLACHAYAYHEGLTYGGACPMRRIKWDEDQLEARLADARSIIQGLGLSEVLPFRCPEGIDTRRTAGNSHRVHPVHRMKQFPIYPGLVPYETYNKKSITKIFTNQYRSYLRSIITNPTDVGNQFKEFTGSSKPFMIVAHVRRGDVSPCSKFSRRYLSNEYYIRLIEESKSNYLKSHPNSTIQVIVFSETRDSGDRPVPPFEPFEEFREKGYDLRLDTPLADVWRMISMVADVIILSKSSFSYVPATLADPDNTKVFYMRFSLPVLPGWQWIHPKAQLKELKELRRRCKDKK